MPKRSTLKLAYVIMSEDGRFFMGDGEWGVPEGNDMYDAKITYSRRWAEKTLKKLDAGGSVFEIGLYNGRPVMLVDAYDYWIDAKYSGIRQN